MIGSRGKSNYEVELAKARLEALKVRMNPHFIANTLTSIRSMLFNDRKDDAIEYLTLFAKLIRTTLENASKDYITLAAELQYIRNYLDIEELRFAGKFTTQIIFSESLIPIDLVVPPSIFQPFIENAINHGLMHRTQGGKLIVEFIPEGHLLKCMIEDNGVGRQKAKEIENRSLTAHSSLSETITRERINLLNKINATKNYSIDTIDLSDNYGNACGTKVEIRIPLQNIYKRADN
ncbi:MAG: histidine kinase [Bacteroidales bacterium]|nr:histidine kinase [Bacteroidales bacterium]